MLFRSIQGMLSLPHSDPLYWVSASVPQLLNFAADSAQLPPSPETYPHLPCLEGYITNPPAPFAPSAKSRPTQGNQRLDSWSGIRHKPGCILTVLAPPSPYPASPPSFLLKAHSLQIPCARTPISGSASRECDLIDRRKLFFFFFFLVQVPFIKKLMQNKS